MAIDDDTTSTEVLESHVQFVVSVLVRLPAVFANMYEKIPVMIDALTKLLEISNNDEIRRAVTHALGYVCDSKTYKILFNLIQTSLNGESDNTSNYSDYIIGTLITSYCYCITMCNITFGEYDIDLFRKLLNSSSPDILKAAHVGLGRVLKNNSLLFELLDSDHIQCYHALISSTACLFVNNTAHNSVVAAAEFVEQHPDLLSIFVVELYNSIRQFTNIIRNVRTTDYYFFYGYPQYVEIASIITVRMPAAFCAFIKDWQDEGDLKRVLFYTSKQHNYSQRAACLTVLSVFGELTIELCEMIIEALRDDPHVQNTCYKCLTRIISIKNETAVLNLLFSYLKSKSMNVRYAAVKMLLHLSRSSLIPFDQVRIALNDLMLNPSSTEDFLLIEEQENAWADSIYYYAGPFKDVVYSLLVKHLTGDTSGTVRRNELNDIDLDFAESEKAVRLSSCLYEEKPEETLPFEKPAKIKSID